MIKRVWFSLLALTLALSLTTPVLALSPDDPVGSMTVKYKVGESYVCVIPENVDLNTWGIYRTVGAEGVLLADGKTLVVTVSSENYQSALGHCVHYAGSYIPYSMQVGERLLSANGDTVLSIPSGTKTGEAKVKFFTTWENIDMATKAGDHTDILTFSFAIH